MAAVSGDLVRSAEWRQVRAFAETAPAAPAALALQGEAGAGKSTLWRAGIEAAAAAGHRLLRSEPSASETDLSFAGLSDLLTGVLPLVADEIPGPQREALEIALLLRPASGEPPAARAVGLAVLAALRGCLSEGPVLVAIDDVQWLDEASLEALAFALRRVQSGPLSLLMAARTEAAADPLTAGAPPPPHGWRDLLAALPATDVIDLVPLDMWQIQNLLPCTVTAAQAREVARQSRGNPFWALQVSASLEGAESQVPPLARTLTDRLSHALSADAFAALAAVAAAGRIGVSEALEALKDLADPAAALTRPSWPAPWSRSATGCRLPTRSSAPRRWSPSRLPAARRSTGGSPARHQIPNDTRTSRPWPRGLVRTKRSPERWTRPPRPRTPGPPTPPLRSSPHRRSR